MVIYVFEQKIAFIFHVLLLHNNNDSKNTDKGSFFKRACLVKFMTLVKQKKKTYDL